MDAGTAATITRIAANCRIVTAPGERGLEPSPVVNGRRGAPVVTDTGKFAAYSEALVDAVRGALERYGFAGLDVTVVGVRLVVTDKQTGGSVSIGL